MGCIGHYEVVEQSFTIGTSTPQIPGPPGFENYYTNTYEVSVAAPSGKVVLGGGIEFDSPYQKRGVTYTGAPAADGSSWTFWLSNNTSSSSPFNWTGTAYVTVAELGG